MSELVRRLRKQASDAIDWDGETLKRWDEIRGMIETRKGSDLPRLMFEGLIENLTELIIEAAARIEALETALREIEDCLDYVKDKGVVWKIARAALDKDNEK
jgi:hypothetical protein